MLSLYRFIFKKKDKHISSKFEERCRKVLEDHYGVKFKPIRPDWLRNPKTGANLELDGYNKKLKIAFEANGIQHYQYDSHFHTCKEDFKQQRYRDKLKARLCKKHGVHLISIPYYVADIKQYIMKHLP